MQVSQAGDIANFMIPGKLVKGECILYPSAGRGFETNDHAGIGGAMDLVSNPDKTKVIATMQHVSKDGTPKIVSECTLPLTGARSVSMIVTDLAVFKVDRVAGELTLTDIAEGLTLDELRAKTACDFRVADVLATF